jgi:hypothetical protein
MKNAGIKQQTTLIVAMCLMVLTGMVQAQNMFLMKSGVVVLKQSLAAAAVDSIVYYEPAHKVTTAAVTNIGVSTATCGGTIAAYDGATVTARGVCWSTSTMPTIALSTKISNGTSTGGFSSSLTGLTSGTTYYLRAYATNSSGVTSYGAEVIFKTLGIGDLYLGGIIVYLDASGIHGFVCTNTDVSANIQWLNGSPYLQSIKKTNAINTELETTDVYGFSKSGGRKNTDAIIETQGDYNYAASICAALTTGNATAGDWYLPSNGELNQIYLKKAILGITSYCYWSSSESERISAYHLCFSGDNNIPSSTFKTREYKVRAVRAF